jgi:hypothetical protein
MYRDRNEPAVASDRLPPTNQWEADPITGLPNGVYHIEITANPEHRLRETTTANNVSRRTVVIGGRPGERYAYAPPHEGVDG